MKIEVAEEFEHLIAGAPVDLIPDLIGEVERLKALLWIRLFTVPIRAVETTCNNEFLLTIPEVAKRLAIKEGRAYELCRQGRLPIVKIGKYVRVDPHTLEAWIQENRDKSSDNDVCHRGMVSRIPKRKEQ